MKTFRVSTEILGILKEFFEIPIKFISFIRKFSFNAEKYN